MPLDHAALVDYQARRRVLNQLLVNDNVHRAFHLRNAKKPLTRVMFANAPSNHADMVAV